MQATQRPTVPDLSTDAPTFPPMSRNRAEGIVWAERLMATARTASGDVARFEAGL